MIQQGTYRARIMSWGLGKASTGNPQLVFQFALDGRLDPGNPETLIACERAERTLFRTITDKTIAFVIRDLKALGYDRDNFDGLNPDSPGSFDFNGMEITVSCKHEVYEGRNKERWDFALGGYQVKPLEAQEVRKLNALFGKKFKEGPAPANRQPAEQPAPLPEPPSDHQRPAPAAATLQDDPMSEIPF